MVKLARNKQCITLYPLTDRYSVGPFPAQVNFRPSEGHLFLAHLQHSVTYGSLLSFSACGPSLQSARLGFVSLLGHFHSITKYGLLTARYGQPIKRTISNIGPSTAH